MKPNAEEEEGIKTWPKLCTVRGKEVLALLPQFVSLTNLKPPEGK